MLKTLSGLQWHVRKDADYRRERREIQKHIKALEADPFKVSELRSAKTDLVLVESPGARLLDQSKEPVGYLSVKAYEQAERRRRQEPVKVGLVNRRTCWWYKENFYLADTDLTADDVDALVNEAANKKRLKLEKAKALRAMTQQLDPKAKRQAIPQDVKVLVWQRDAGRCAQCGSQQNLEYDHIIPLAMGGSNTDRNLQLLCEVCNRRKGATLG